MGLTGDDAALRKLQTQLAQTDKLASRMVDTTRDVVEGQYKRGFTAYVSPWGDKWEPARFSEGNAPGYLTGELAATPVTAERSGGMGAVRIRQPRHGAMVQGGAPRGGEADGTRRGTIPWAPESNWDPRIEGGFVKNVEAWFST